MLAMALLSYSGDNGGAFPDTLWRLTDDGYAHAGEVANPADVDPSPEDMGIYHRYYYFGNSLRDDNPQSTETPLLVYPFRKGDSRNVCILYIDGHVTEDHNLSQEEILFAIGPFGHSR